MELYIIPYQCRRYRTIGGIYQPPYTFLSREFLSFRAKRGISKVININKMRFLASLGMTKKHRFGVFNELPTTNPYGINQRGGGHIRVLPTTNPYGIMDNVCHSERSEESPNQLSTINY